MSSSKDPLNQVSPLLLQIPAGMDRHFPFFLDIESDEPDLSTCAFDNLSTLSNVDFRARSILNASLVQGPLVAPGIDLISSGPIEASILCGTASLKIE